jgi:hypothetical protein
VRVVSGVATEIFYIQGKLQLSFYLVTSRVLTNLFSVVSEVATAIFHLQVGLQLTFSLVTSWVATDIF